jgi:hypothetical protein
MTAINTISLGDFDNKQKLIKYLLWAIQNQELTNYTEIE